MALDFSDADYAWIRELLDYPSKLETYLAFFKTTADILIPDDPIEKVVFQDQAKAAIRKVARNKGHILMVGRPGTGKSLLADMFEQVLRRSMGDYLRPRKAVVAYPGKDRHHIRIAYEMPERINRVIEKLQSDIDTAADAVPLFDLAAPIRSVRRMKWFLIGACFLALALGFFYPLALAASGLAAIGAIFLFIQENSHKVQEKIQRFNLNGGRSAVKHLMDLVPEVLYDPKKDVALMTRVAEPNARNMKGGFRHDPYQSGQLHTPAHKRAFLGAHATAPILFIDELKTLIATGYMPQLLEIMQNKTYTLEGGGSSGSGAADRSETPVKCDNIIVACCNHDTLAFLQSEGDGAFLSRIEGKGEIIRMESAVAENEQTIRQTAQYIKQEIESFAGELRSVWRQIADVEGDAGVRRRCEQIMGRKLPRDFALKQREFSRAAVMEIIKELRCRASDGKLSCILRPVNGIIRAAQYSAMSMDADIVGPAHIRHALKEHMSLEGALTRERIIQKKDLKKYIATLTDAIGYVVGLAVFSSRSSGQMYGQPLPIHGQIMTGTADMVTAPGNLGDIAKAAAQNVRASIKKVFKAIGAPYVGYEMYVEYIQAHGGVEGDSASVAVDIALISDYIQQPVNQTIGVTGSLTGDIILPVGGVTEKLRAIMDSDLGMAGACIPWQNKYDVQPLLINIQAEYFCQHGIPAIRIYRKPERRDPFDIFFCKTKFNAYRIVMGLDRRSVQERMAERCMKDWRFMRRRMVADRPSGHARATATLGDDPTE